MKERLTESEREEYRKAFEGSYLPNWQYSHLEQSERAAWDEVERLTTENAEKDATIKELQEALGKPKSHLLFELHNERALKEQAIRARDTALKSHYTLEQENIVLRKALEEAKKEAEQGESGSLERADEAIRNIINLCAAVLGEGDKE